MTKNTTMPNDPNYELAYCDSCGVMTHHLNGKCMKSGHISGFRLEPCPICGSEMTIDTSKNPGAYCKNDSAHPVDGEIDEAMSRVLTKLENDVEHSTAMRMNGRTTNNRMIHANAITELSDLVATHLQGAVREAQVKYEGIGAYMAMCRIQEHVGYLLAHRASGQYGEMTSEVIHDLWKDIKKIQTENDKYMRPQQLKQTSETKQEK